MTLFILEENLPKDTLYLIEKCKSSSMLKGFSLRDTHYTLGKYIADEIFRNIHQQNKTIALLILMRAGLLFGLGIADQLEKLGKMVSIHFINNDILSPEILNMLANKTVVLADAVINSGETVHSITNQLPETTKQSLIIATTVIPFESLNLFKHTNLMTVRTSLNKYKGAKVANIQNGKGPDTGDRLFGTI